MKKKEYNVLYPKNVPNYERGLRILGGIIITLFALSGSVSTVAAILLILSAVVLVGTGFIGWCPMCALVGRKIRLPRPR